MVSVTNYQSAIRKQDDIEAVLEILKISPQKKD